MLIFDAHLDLAMNAMEWNRDLNLPVQELREREKGMTDKPDREKATVSFPEMRKGNVRLCVATLIARYVKKGSDLPGWQSQEQAWAQTQGQLSWYREMERKGILKSITNTRELESHLEAIHDKTTEAIGYILSLEGADSLVSMEHLHWAYEKGLRAIGPAHYGPGIYAHGTDAQGGLGPKGRELLRQMEALHIILDATHLCDQSFWEAMDLFCGPVWASHNNCRELVDHNRQFSDEQLRELIRRKSVIGVALDAWMLAPGWIRGKSSSVQMGVGLNSVADHIDHICQLAGNSDHAGLGTDLDGAFGTEQCPYDLDTIADLQKMQEILVRRGYTEKDIEKIMHGNFISFLKRVWE